MAKKTTDATESATAMETEVIASAEENVAQTTQEAIETENERVDGNDATGEKEETQTSTAAEKAAVFVYVGPSLPRGLLKKGTALKGSKEQVLQYLDHVIADYPEVKRLLVRSDELAEARARLQIGGNILSSKYDELLRKINKK